MLQDHCKVRPHHATASQLVQGVRSPRSMVPSVTPSLLQSGCRPLLVAGKKSKPVRSEQRWGNRSMKIYCILYIYN